MTDSRIDSHIDEEKELDMWKAEWATLGSSADLATELAARVKKDTFRRNVGIGGEVLTAALTSSFGVWFAISMKGDAPAIALCVGFLLFNGIWLTRLFKMLKDKEPASGDVASYVKLTRDRHESMLRWLDFARRALAPLAIACFAWMTWVVHHAGLDLRDPFAVVPFGAAALIVAGVWFVNRTMCRRLVFKHERFEALIAERTLE